MKTALHHYFHYEFHTVKRFFNAFTSIWSKRISKVFYSVKSAFSKSKFRPSNLIFHLQIQIAFTVHENWKNRSPDLCDRKSLKIQSAFPVIQIGFCAKLPT